MNLQDYWTERVCVCCLFMVHKPPWYLKLLYYIKFKNGHSSFSHRVQVVACALLVIAATLQQYRLLSRAGYMSILPLFGKTYFITWMRNVIVQCGTCIHYRITVNSHTLLLQQHDTLHYFLPNALSLEMVRDVSVRNVHKECQGVQLYKNWYSISWEL